LVYTFWIDAINRVFSDAKMVVFGRMLLHAGIDTQRMTFKGYGATKMVYPDARSEDKMEKNRRVEILVTGFE